MERTISVTGTGRVSVVPDIATVRLGVTVTRPTVREARADAAAAGARILAALDALGVARADVRTETLAVQPEMEYGERGAVLKGQQVSHRYAVTVRDLASLAAVIDDALAAGASNLEGVDFRYDDARGAEREARRAAMRDARERAELLAAEAGVSLGKVASIAETGTRPPPRPVAAFRMAAMEAAPTPVEGGSLEIEASVEVVFEIA